MTIEEQIPAGVTSVRVGFVHQAGGTCGREIRHWWLLTAINESLLLETLEIARICNGTALRPIACQVTVADYGSLIAASSIAVLIAALTLPASALPVPAKSERGAMVH